jgi:hypothetical protein
MVFLEEEKMEQKYTYMQTNTAKQEWLLVVTTHTVNILEDHLQHTEDNLI